MVHVSEERSRHPDQDGTLGPGLRTSKKLNARPKKKHKLKMKFFLFFIASPCTLVQVLVSQSQSQGCEQNWQHWQNWRQHQGNLSLTYEAAASCVLKLDGQDLESELVFWPISGDVSQLDSRTNGIVWFGQRLVWLGGTPYLQCINYSLCVCFLQIENLFSFLIPNSSTRLPSIASNVSGIPLWSSLLVRLPEWLESHHRVGRGTWLRAS